MSRRFLTATAFAAFAAMVALRHPPAAATFSAGGLLTSVPAEPAPSRGDVLRAERGTYIAQVLLERDSTFNRWPARLDAPIRVWIQPIGELGFVDQVRASFAEWTRVGLPIRFVFVDEAGDAELRVRWTQRLDHKTGNTLWRVDDHGWLRSGDILLATHLSNGRPLDSRSLQAIALHEIGHAIGLGHSDDHHDIMAPLVRVATLSAADRSTARLLYTMPAGHLR